MRPVGFPPRIHHATGPGIGAGAAIINAVYDACGVLIMDLPVTSEKILMALKAKEAKNTDRFITDIPPNAMKLLDMGREITKKWQQAVKDKK